MNDVSQRRNGSGVRIVDTVALVLVIIGGLNWGLVGFFEFNLVTALLGSMTVLSRLVYILVGLSAVWTAGRTPHLVHTGQPHAQTPHPV